MVSQITGRKYEYVEPLLASGQDPGRYKKVVQPV